VNLLASIQEVFILNLRQDTILTKVFCDFPQFQIKSQNCSVIEQTMNKQDRKGSLRLVKMEKSRRWQLWAFHDAINYLLGWAEQNQENLQSL
jgi:hypothetical protein